MVRANCSNCGYVIYRESDKVRFERCSIFGNFNIYPNNPRAVDLVSLQDVPQLCEKYLPAEELKSSIVYE